MSLAKVWFLACKKGVFAGQEVGFCIVKVWFLFFECCVVAIRQQCFGNPFAAVGGRFIVPAYTYTPTKWGTKIRVR